MTQENLFEKDGRNVSVHENIALKAKVIGVGGAGLSLVDGLRLDNFTGVEQLVIDVDARALADSIASEKMTIGRTLTRGMGTGGEAALARKAISEEKDNVRKTLEGVDLIFLLAGLGGGTGGGGEGGGDVGGAGGLLRHIVVSVNVNVHVSATSERTR